MLITYSSIDGGWTANLIAIFGLIMFFIGLYRLGAFLDEKGKSGASLLIWAAILSLIAYVFGLIPLVGVIPQKLFNFIAFILQLIGLLKLKRSATLGTLGASGVNYLLISIVLILVTNFLNFFFGIISNIVPFVDNFIRLPALIAFVIIPFGWLKIQRALIESNGNTSNLSKGGSINPAFSKKVESSYSFPQQAKNAQVSQPKHEKNNTISLSEQEGKVVTYFTSYGFKTGDKIVMNKKSRKIEKFDEQDWNKIVRSSQQNEWIIISEK